MMIVTNRRRVLGGKQEMDWSTQYLTFEALQDGWFRNSQMPMEYSLDKGKTWVSLPANTNTPTVPAGKKILWKSTLNRGDKAGRFQSQRQYDVTGNIMSIVFGDAFIGKDDLTGYNNVFDNLFRDANINSAENLCMPVTTLADSCCSYMFGFSKIVKAPNILPATTLANSCYSYMFRSCNNLIDTPQLPATTLANDCYLGMFWSCTSLTIAPELPATEMVRQCCGWMFYQCTNLTTAPALPATTLAYRCYCCMFAGCTSLVTAPQLPATTLAEDCYSGIFQGCTSLVSAPELPAITLVRGCYDNMFRGCTSLNYIKALFTTTPSNTYTKDWVNGVAESGTFGKNVNASWNVTGVNGIPTGWTVQTASE